MKIDFISDTHEAHRKLDKAELFGDIIACTGDITPTGQSHQIEDFISWYENLDYDYKILIAGNHDHGLQDHEDHWKEYMEDHGIIYLSDSGAYVWGLNFWGMPWTPEFYDWAFMYKRGSKFAYDKINMIPDYTDILLTHGPPYGIMDIAERDMQSHGCKTLLQKVLQVKPKIHAFGHMHYQHGIQISEDTTFIKASIMDENYKPIRKPITVYI